MGKMNCGSREGGKDLENEMVKIVLLLGLLQACYLPVMSQNIRVYPIDSTSDQNVQVPPTPCPQTFQYQYGSNGWTGLIAVPPPNSEVSLRSIIPIKLEVRLRVFGLLPSKYVGRLELAENKQNVLQKVLQGDSARGLILYRLHFPTSNSLPYLILISLNGNTICTGNPNLIPSHGRIITSIALEHTFYPSANALNVDSVINNNNNNNNNNNDYRGNPNFNQRINYNQGQNFQQGQHFNTGQTFNQGQNFNQGQTFGNQGQNFNGGFFGDPFAVGNPDDTFTSPQFPVNDGRRPITSTNSDGVPPSFGQRPALRPQIQQASQNSQVPQNTRGQNNAQGPQIVQNPQVNPEPQGIEEPYLEQSPKTQPVSAKNTTASLYEQEFLKGQDRACGKPLLSNQLVAKGKKIKKGAWPWLVAVFRKFADVSGLRFTCGGTLINEEYVITAAHCVAEEKKMVEPDRLLLYLGKFNLESWTEADVQPKDVKEIIVHPDYKTQGSDADIALLQLSVKAVYNQFVQPACLWPFKRKYEDGKDYSDLSPLVGRHGTVMGWGRDESGNLVTQEPRFVTVPVVSQRECFDSHNGLRHFTSNRTLCAGSRDGSGPCNGDSGGGLLFLVTDNNDSRWFLRGIVSLSLTDAGRMCDLRNYIVYSDVAKFGDWLSRYIHMDWRRSVARARDGKGWSSVDEDLNPNWDLIQFRTL